MWFLLVAVPHGVAAYRLLRGRPKSLYELACVVLVSVLFGPWFVGGVLGVVAVPVAAFIAAAALLAGYAHGRSSERT